MFFFFSSMFSFSSKKKKRLQEGRFELPKALSHRIATTFFFLFSRERKTLTKKKEKSFVLFFSVNAFLFLQEKKRVT